MPPGATSAHVVVHDDVDPHAGVEWCKDSCSAEIGQFCDETTVNVTGTTTLFVVPNAAEIDGVVPCAVGSQMTLGEATSGTITVDFS